MKKGIFTLAFLFLACSLFAQDTLVATNMGLGSLIGTSPMGRVRTNPATSTFSIATNGNWDLTNLSYDSSFYVTRISSPVSGYSFADTISRSFVNKFIFAGLGVNLGVLQDLSEWKQAVDPQLFLVKKLGGTSDTVYFPTQVASYSSPYYKLKFPLTYHSVMNSSYSYATVFDISDSILNIYRTPSTIYSRVKETDSVLGWGKMRVNRKDSANGAPIKSAFVNVLQVRVRNNQIDSYVIAPHTNLYDSLGFTYTITIDTAIDSLNPPAIDSTPVVDTMTNIATVLVINGTDTTISYDTTYTYDTTGYAYDTTYVSYTFTNVYHYNIKDTANTYMELFYRVGTITPIATVVYTDATFSTIKHVYLNTDVSEFPEGVETVPDQYAINVYPNPVTDGKTYIDIAEPGAGNWSYNLVNMMGQCITTQTIPTNGGSVHQQANLPTNLPRGIYYLRVNNNGKQAFVKALNVAN